MTWEVAIIVSYLAVGVLCSLMASIGHKSMYGSRLPWHTWVAGIIGWPAVFLIGGRKK